MSDTAFFSHNGLKLAYSATGRGPALILVHGWPFHKAIFRKLIPLLSHNYTCYALDLAGMGESDWTSDTDLGFHAQAERVIALADHLDLRDYALLGHDTGGTVARFAALKDKNRVTAVAVMDSEIPFHFPPAVTLVQKLHRGVLTRGLLKRVLASRIFARSTYGHAGFFKDPAGVTPDYMDLFVHSWHRTSKAYSGLLAYLCAVEPDVIDTLDTLHADIKAPMMFIWGRGDMVFPIRHARDMAARIPSHAPLVEIANARFLPQEEQPDEVARHLLPFLNGARSAA
jgi:pimeloyl-ACP methyl ester carboxylesterase